MPSTVCSPDEKSASDLPGLYLPGEPFGEAGPSGASRRDLPRRRAPDFRILYCKYGMPGGPHRGISFGAEGILGICVWARLRGNPPGHLYSPSMAGRHSRAEERRASKIFCVLGRGAGVWLLLQIDARAVGSVCPIFCKYAYERKYRDGILRNRQSAQEHPVV